MQLDPALGTAFRRIVLDSWQTAHAEAATIRSAREKQLRSIELKKERLTSKFVEDLIDKESYRKLAAQFDDELSLAMTDHSILTSGRGSKTSFFPRVWSSTGRRDLEPLKPPRFSSTYGKSRRANRNWLLR